MCNKADFTGYYFRKFSLPDKDPYDGRPYENSTAAASWYFLNRLNFVACIEKCMTIEDFSNLEDQPTN